MDEVYGMEYLWDDAEEFERNCLAEDGPEWDEDDEEENAEGDWEMEPREDFGFFGEAGLSD
jgi:hypothetical protein